MTDIAVLQTVSLTKPQMFEVCKFFRLARAQRSGYHSSNNRVLLLFTLAFKAMFIQA